MSVGDGIPVSFTDSKGGRLTSGSGCAVDMKYLLCRYAEVIAEGRCSLLCLPQILLGNHWNPVFEILKSSELIGVKAGFIPLLTVKWGSPISVLHNQSETLQNRSVPQLRIHGFALREPIWRFVERTMIRIVAGRKRPRLHANGRSQATTGGHVL
jgi:hypothetical protein